MSSNQQWFWLNRKRKLTKPDPQGLVKDKAKKKKTKE